MLKCSKNKLWIENPINLICSGSIIPLEGMSYSEQMNSISRLVILIFVVMIILKIKDSIFYLILSLLFIIILYYYQRNNMLRQKDNFEYSKPKTYNYHNLPKPYMNNYGWNNPQSKRWCNDSVNLDKLPTNLAPELMKQNPNYTKEGIINNPEYVSKNQKLTGQKVNPKTLIAPVIAPPIVELDYWKTNNLVNYSQINSESNTDLYQSGYIVQPDLKNNYELEYYNKEQNTCENYQGERIIKEINIPTGNLEYNGDQTEFKYPYLRTEKDSIVVLPGGSGQVNGGCGFYPEQQFSSNLPANLPTGNVQKDPVMKQYNTNLFTQTIQPGVYTTNQVIEPINSNMGISFTQQFEPLTHKTNPISGDIEFTEHDPRIIDTDIFTEEQPTVETNSTESNIYDPRFSGAGTTYRSYTDDNVGQTRFYYDDVDAVRMPNYLVRSNIDRDPFADHYGTIPKGNQFGNQNTANIRELANNQFLDSSMEFRTDLQERLMRKANARAWQQRLAPISTSGQRMGGGMHRIV